MTERPSDEAVERMVALVRDLALRDPMTGMLSSRYADEARRIAFMLPKPVDPAVLACRGIVSTYWLECPLTDPLAAARVVNGEKDDCDDMRIAITAYHAGQASNNGAMPGA